MTDNKQQQQKEIQHYEEESHCPACNGTDWDWSTVWVVGMETQAKMCCDCGYVYGGDLE
jgi:hypothetical protein